MYDVVVVGAGLGGLSAARDLLRAGCDVLVLEARGRPGGRVEQRRLPDGRVMQLGGEVVGPPHTAYLALVEELGLTLERSYVAHPGQMSWGLVEGVHVGDDLPWMTPSELAANARCEQAFAELVASVDPEDPWRHPDAERLDRLSVGAWLRGIGAPPAVRRRWKLAARSLSTDGPERTSLLSELRKHAAVANHGTYDLQLWEGLRVAEGSAIVALRMAEELAERLRLGAVVRRIDVEDRRVRVGLRDGEELHAEAVVCAVPAGPLRDVEITGLSVERLASLRAQRHALAAKVVAAYRAPFWESRGQNGLAETEWLFGSTWPQRDGVLSMLVPPERLSAFLAAPVDRREAAVLDGLIALYGDEAGDPLELVTREWGVDPFTRGYITSWAPGDVTRVGPLHGRHEPPFYVAGSDHWVAGYMEGAVRTGRAAAAAALASGVV